jgi:hypothetical protein
VTPEDDNARGAEGGEVLGPRQELDDALTLAFARLVVADFEGGGKLAQGAAEQKSGV